MIIRQFSAYCCKAELMVFIEDLFSNWKHESSFSNENSCCPERHMNELIEKIQSADGDASDFMIAFDAQTEMICGILYIAFDSNKSAHIQFVNVSPDFRRRNVGFSLLKESMFLSINKGIDNITLETWKENNRAIALFEKFGFVKFFEDKRTVRLKADVKAVCNQDRMKR